jgi:ferredoxin
MIRVKVNRAVCQGNARCFAVAPEVFTLDDEGYNVGGEFEVPDELAEAAFRGAGECPERAILLFLD